MAAPNPLVLSPVLILAALVPTLSVPTRPAVAQEAKDAGIELAPVLVPSAEEALKQSPGVSIITSEDIDKHPPTNDLSEIIRRMPGVNLTGNTASGIRGNNRQIDIRGMGPENTLILIDGKPVSARNAVRYGRSGERDTRGDSNWVPAEMVESIEVIRGPAAARYGSGAAGGVVNIITKGVGTKVHGSATVYASQPQDGAEGETRRGNVSLSGPMGDQFGFRIYGNYNKTDADDADINVGHTSSAYPAAGREGVENKDLSALLRWAPTTDHTFDLNYAYSRQGNIYAGDTQSQSSATSSSGATGSNAQSFLGEETNIMVRNAVSLEHRGSFAMGDTKSYVQYEKTDNSRLDEGLTAAGEGNITSNHFSTSINEAYRGHSEITAPLKLVLPQTLSAGVEADYERLEDPASIVNSESISGIAGLADSAANRAIATDAQMLSAFVEDNVELSDRWTVTPGLRLDNHSDFGANWSPSLNTSYSLTDAMTLKGGIARAFKAPNLYQSNANYLWYSRGNGCNQTAAYTTRCYLLGNDNLDPEISINKEIGVNWSSQGWNAGLTWFRNDYKNKIVAGTDVVATVTVSGQQRYVYRWENATNAVIEGFEANLAVPLADALRWSNNATFMRRNDDQYGQPLSIIPQFTVNSNLDWQVDEDWSLGLSATFYGRQKPRSTSVVTSSANSDVSGITPYNIWGISTTYALNDAVKARLGVANIFDKRVYREGNGESAGASTYNEAGRAFYASATVSF